LKALVDNVCRPAYVFNNGELPPDPTKPYGSPLSLKVPDLSYVIYKLSKRSWQFACRGYPLTVGTSSYSRYFCFEASRCAPYHTGAIGEGYDGRDQGSAFEVPVMPRNECKVAFFVVNGTLARANEADGEYEHAFNLHVDLLFADDHHLPIMIDPDVRYPGGAGS